MTKQARRRAVKRSFIQRERHKKGLENRLHNFFDHFKKCWEEAYGPYCDHITWESLHPYPEDPYKDWAFRKDTKYDKIRG